MQPIRLYPPKPPPSANVIIINCRIYGKTVTRANLRRWKELEFIMIMKTSLVRTKIIKSLLKFQGQIEFEPQKGQEAERYEEMY